MMRMRGGYFVRCVRPTRRRALMATRWTSTTSQGRLAVLSQEEMEALGARLAHKRSKGDVIFLRGDLGCGKTCLARGFVRAMVRDTALQVTSPTYLLVNTYEAVDSVIHHVDLYRLEKVSDVDAMALGLTDAFANGISLVEWPQRLQTQGVPAERLEVSIDYDQETESTTRHVSFHSFGKRWEGFVLD